jgi:hypothetical protein
VYKLKFPINTQQIARGDVLVVPPGNNAWVVGNEPKVADDFTVKTMLRSMSNGSRGGD